MLGIYGIPDLDITNYSHIYIIFFSTF